MASPFSSAPLFGSDSSNETTTNARPKHPDLAVVGHFSSQHITNASMQAVSGNLRFMLWRLISSGKFQAINPFAAVYIRRRLPGSERDGGR